MALQFSIASAVASCLFLKKKIEVDETQIMTALSQIVQNQETRVPTNSKHNDPHFYNGKVLVLRDTDNENDNIVKAEVEEKKHESTSNSSSH